MARVLITVAGGRLGIGVANGLLKSSDPIEVIATDASPYQLQRSPVLDKRYLLPAASDPSYVDVIRRLVRSEDVDVVWPNHEAEILRLARERDNLDARLFLPPADAIELCQDKMASFECLHRAGVAVPESMLIRDKADLEDAFKRFGTPVWVRAIKGAGGEGSRAVFSIKKASQWIDLHDGWGAFMAAEYLSPRTVTWESIWDHGKLIIAQGRERLYWEFGSLTASGVTGITGAEIWVNDPVVDDVSERAVRALGGEAPHGLFSVDMTYDQDSYPRVTEINGGRFMSASFVVFPQMGYNAAEIALRLAMGQDVGFPTPVINPYPEDVVMVHGMDIEPVVVPASNVRQLQEQLDSMRAAAAR